MKKALRIGYHRYYNDAVFAEHLAFIKRNADVIDELALFTEYSHYGYWDLETSAKNAEVIKNRIGQYRKAGIKRVGVNILCTMGHVEEGWDVFPKAPLQYQVNQDGAVSSSCLCPSNDAFLEYIKKDMRFMRIRERILSGWMTISVLAITALPGSIVFARIACSGLRMNTVCSLRAKSWYRKSRRMPG